MAVTNVTNEILVQSKVIPEGTVIVGCHLDVGRGIIELTVIHQDLDPVIEGMSAPIHYPLHTVETDGTHTVEWK
jgi:hypothetical protein